MKNKLTIHVLANDGSPLGVSEASIHGEDGRMGVGGAELAILTLMAGWAEAGHDVTFYNNPQHGYHSKFRHAPISLFVVNEYRDILIVFRSPSEKAKRAKAGLKVWFSTDQYTVGDFAEFSKHVDKIVTISDFHSAHFSTTYGINDSIVIDLPVRTWEYRKEIERVPNRMIFCSVPTRGLDIMAKCYPKIQAEVQDASLVITSDFRLWGAHSPMNEAHIRRFMGMNNVTFMGAVPRQQLIDEQIRAEVHAYPCTYDELFCYSSAECQIAGCFPISSSVGALATTNMGLLVHGDPHTQDWQNIFIQVVVETLRNREHFRQLAVDNQKRAVERFSLDRILKEWDERVFHG